MLTIISLYDNLYTCTRVSDYMYILLSIYGKLLNYKYMYILSCSLFSCTLTSVLVYNPRLHKACHTLWAIELNSITFRAGSLRLNAIYNPPICPYQKHSLADSRDVDKQRDYTLPFRVQVVDFRPLMGYIFFCCLRLLLWEVSFNVSRHNFSWEGGDLRTGVTWPSWRMRDKRVKPPPRSIPDVVGWW